MRFLEKTVQCISEQILPTACISCQQFQTETICHACLENLHWNSLIKYECCFQCGIPLQSSELPSKRCDHCTKSEPFFDKTYCLDRYDGILQDALHQLKYQKRIACAHGLARAWNKVIANPLDFNEVGYLIPVPLSQEKLHTRGFNQSWELARRIDCAPIQKLPRLLKRHHHAKHQVGSTLTARQDAVREMFYIDDRYIGLMKNKTVIVFDDVMTTGATLNEIARILKESGVSLVINWVLLRTTRSPQ